MEKYVDQSEKFAFIFLNENSQKNSMHQQTDIFCKFSFSCLHITLSPLLLHLPVPRTFTTVSLGKQDSSLK